LSLTSFGFHKFYVAVYQLCSEREMLQITSRVFADDLNKALEKKYNKKHYIGTDKESPEDLVLLKIFCGKLNDKSQWTIQVHGSLSKEMEGCSFAI
jgi:elongation factor P hydroxylase